MCGENLGGQMMRVRVGGSSPRVRGKRVQITDQTAGQRLIPACAGKTAVEAGNPRVARAHPRVCGENAVWAAAHVADVVSSPRVRGKRWWCGCMLRRLGLIPACAGKTIAHQLKKPAAAAHPRVCGENARGSHFVGEGVGSSPRVRGKL